MTDSDKIYSVRELKDMHSFSKSRISNLILKSAVRGDYSYSFQPNPSSCSGWNEKLQPYWCFADMAGQLCYEMTDNSLYKTISETDSSRLSC